MMRTRLRAWMVLALALAGALSDARAQPGRGAQPADRPTADGGPAADRRDAMAARRLERQERREQVLGRVRDGMPDDRGFAGQEGRGRLDPQKRQMLEQRVRERFGEVVRRQLALSDDQFRRLRETNRQYEGQRRDLVQRERTARAAIRDELGQPNGGDEARVGDRMQELLALQRERLSLTEAEDRQLAEFLSPQQRARYFGLQEQLRRRVEEMRRRAMLGQPQPPE